jgi:hypothetical protein
MNGLENIILSEVSQEKAKNHVFPYMVTYYFIG